MILQYKSCQRWIQAGQSGSAGHLILGA